MPYRHQIKERFESLVPMTEKDWQIFSSKLKFVTYKRSDYITRYNEVENKLLFLVDGIVRHFIIKENETTSDFAFPGNFFSSYSSFITRKPSLYEITPVTRTADCYYITYEDLQEVYALTNCGEKIGRLAAEQQFLKKAARENSLLTLSPREKYLQLMEEHPHFIKSIPLKYLASFIGITPETLSRIRSSIS